MDNQLSFDNYSPPAPEPPDPIAEAFEDFHRRRPEVLDQLIKLVAAAFHNGQRASVRDLFGWFRVQKAIEFNPDVEGFQLNNDFTALYAREIIKKRPDLAPALKTRTRKK